MGILDHRKFEPQNNRLQPEYIFWTNTKKRFKNLLLKANQLLTTQNRRIMHFSSRQLILLCALSFVSLSVTANPILGAPKMNLELGTIGLEDGATFNNYFLSGNQQVAQQTSGPFGFAINNSEEPPMRTIDQNYHVMQGRNGQVRVMPAQMFQWKMYQGKK